jgi:GNAT superfamily N-acetyltransferase
LDTQNIRFVEILNLNDHLLPAWLDLYETAFPPVERLLVSNHLKVLRAKAEGNALDIHLLSVLDGSGELVGIARYRLLQEVRANYFEYMAVRDSARNRGIGSRIYREVVSRSREAGMRGMLLEVETPENAPSPAESQLAARRIGFYRRHGASLLKGIHYLHTVGPHQPKMPMHIMVHCLTAMSAEQAFDFAKSALGSALSRTGAISLE